jgi:hypothetical protein
MKLGVYLCKDVIDLDTAVEGSLWVLGFGEAAQDELLCHVGGRSLSGINKELAQEQPDAAIRRRIVCIREGSRGQIAAHGRIVRLPQTVVSFADEWAGERMQSARLVCAEQVVSAGTW